ncbi:MAG: FAD:protein FMN transferase [Clostridiaceae bacterium]
MLQSAITEMSDFGMNTSITYRVIGEKGENVIALAESEVLRLEKKLSRFIADSEVSKINLNSGLCDVKISNETYEVLSYALTLSEITQGLFDITVAPLIDLWDYKHSFRVPFKFKIQRNLHKINYHELILNPDDKTAFLRRSGQAIDLGGIGKGYASDRCIKLFKQYGVTSAYVSIGGNVSTLGIKPDESLWSVGIRHPRFEGCLIGAVKVSGKSVVTSGDYERYFVDRKGNRWHHILNPTTGYPARSGLVSVTVVNESAMTADALSTAIFVAGINKGLGYLDYFKGSEVILVDDNLKVYITKGLNEYFQPLEGLKVSII